MASLSTVVNVSISVVAARAAAAGFGTPLILSHSATWSERVRSYSSLAGVLADFAATTPEYKAANAIFSQPIAPTTVKIGRAALVPTQRWAITPVVSNSTVYKMTIVSTAGVETVCSYTSDASATVTEIIAGLKALIDAVGLAVTVSDQTTYMRIVANVAGVCFGVYVDDVSKLGIAMDHADPGVATDLAAIVAEDSNWYALLTLFNSSAVVAAAAAWIESSGMHFYEAATQDSVVVTAATGIGLTLKTAAYRRTACIYHPRNHQFADAAFLGKWLPTTPGSENTKFLTLTGITATVLTDTQRSNALGKYVMVYDTIGAVPMTEEGHVASGEWIDVIRGIDWLASDMGTAVFNLQLALANAQSKIPFTDEGVSQIKALVLGSLKKGVRTGFLSPDPAPTVSAPKVAEVSSTDKAARNLPSVTGSAVLAGAINSTAVNITLTT